MPWRKLETSETFLQDMPPGFRRWWRLTVLGKPSVERITMVARVWVNGGAARLTIEAPNAARLIAETPGESALVCGVQMERAP